MSACHQIIRANANTHEEAIRRLDVERKARGTISATIVLDDKYVLSLPTRDKADSKFIKDNMNSARQIISKEKAKDRLRRKLEERRQ
jgi:hypothetical protein